MKAILRLLIKFFRKNKIFFNLLYNLFVLKYHKVKYNSWPLINGRILVRNAGKINLGTTVVFNNNTLANGIGIYKQCSLIVRENGILIIGNQTGFSGVSIYCVNKITIGDYVKCGGNVSIWDTDFHPLNYLERRNDLNEKAINAKIIIGDDVFIGANSIILKGARIGSRSIIGAGSVVSKNIPEDEIWGGNPIKFIRKANE